VEMRATSSHRVAGSRRRVWLIAVAGLVVIFLILAGIKAGQIGTMIKAGKAFAMPPEAVTAAKVEPSEWQASRSAPATLVAVRAVTVASEVPGTVRELGFDSGAYVRRGDVMLKLDTSTEEAQLAAAQADAELARATLHRARTLRASGTNTPADLDAAEARAKAAAAAAATLQATIAKKTIRAPFDGRVSIRQVELGQVLSPGTAIASLVSITPVYADFYLPQQALADLRPGMQTRLHTDVFPDSAWDGVISTINSEVDIATRNVRVRATFPNDDGRLRPGMYGTIEVLSPDKRKVLVIPSTSVLYAPYGDSVFTVEEKKEANQSALVAHQKFVRVGEHRGDLVAVTSGLQAGETVVTSGAFKLRNGSTLVVRNDLAPSAEIAPKPTDR
jgi:membrane fusion protein (multidrug efflux system)